MEEENCVEIKALTKSFNSGHNKAIDNLSLNIPKGRIIGLIGADGSGKTTLLRLINGLLRQDDGNITVFGMDPVKQKSELAQKVGYMPQKFGLYEDLTVRENLEFYADLKGVGKNFDDMLKFAGLENFQTRLAGKLSGGMKQKLGLICALMGNPELLLLDEPSVGVDPVSRRELLKMVKSSVSANTTVVWSTAYMDEAHGFDISVVLDKGNIVYFGNPHDLASDSKSFEEKIIELMGGFVPQESQVAKNFTISECKCDYVIEADNLVKKYGDFYAVKNNSFQIKRGEIFGLLGPNGAGKSTSFKMMCGLAKPTAGTARIMGFDIVSQASLARENIGYMAQKFSLYPNLSVKQNLDFFAGAYGLYGKEAQSATEQMTEIFGFEHYLDDNAQELPLGFKQRLSLACAVMHNPAVLFLDEPTSGVDVIARREFWNHITALAQKGVTVMVTTHFMDEAEFCDRISLFYKGETIATGTPFELKQYAQAQTMEDTFINLIEQKEGNA